MMGLDEIKEANAKATEEANAQAQAHRTVCEDLCACITVLTKIGAGECEDPAFLARAMIGTLALRHGVLDEHPAEQQAQAA